jgi:hypothetical protein
MSDRQPYSDNALDCALHALFAERVRCEQPALDEALLQRCMQAVDNRVLFVEDIADDGTIWKASEGKAATASEPSRKVQRSQRKHGTWLIPALKVGLVAISIILAVLFVFAALTGPSLRLLDAPSLLRPLLFITAMLCLGLCGWYAFQKIWSFGGGAYFNDIRSCAASSQLSTTVSLSHKIFRK